MRRSCLVLVLACTAACAHGRRNPAPLAAPRQLVVPDRIETVSVFEVRPGNTDADRHVGDFNRTALLADFEDLHTTACARNVHLALVAFAPGGHATEEITYGGTLPRLRFFFDRQRWDGVDIPC